MARTEPFRRRQDAHGDAHSDPCGRDVAFPSNRYHTPYHQAWEVPLYHSRPHTPDEWATAWSVAHEKITAWCRSTLERLPQDQILMRVQTQRARYHDTLSTCPNDEAISLESLLFLRCLDDATRGSGLCWAYPFP